MEGLVHIPLDYEVLVREVYEAVVRPGDVVLDVGAHLGRHTIPLARRVGPAGHVHAFEPLPSCRAALAQLLHASHPDLAGRITLHPFALGAATGESDFVVAVDRPGYSGLRPRCYELPTRLERIRVRVRAIDELFLDLPALRYLKIDAEGGELDVLRGAAGCLAKFRPVVGFEFGANAIGAYGITPRDLACFLREQGYTIRGIDGRRLTVEQFAQSARAQEICDYVAVPAEDRADDEAVATVLWGRSLHWLRARSALAAAADYAALVGQVPPLRRLPAGLRVPARWLARAVLLAAEVFLRPLRYHQAALAVTVAPLIEGLCGLERALHQSQRRVAELERTVAALQGRLADREGAQDRAA
jgi:FkbM family methyltransferase